MLLDNVLDNAPLVTHVRRAPCEDASRGEERYIITVGNVLMRSALCALTV